MDAYSHAKISSDKCYKASRFFSAPRIHSLRRFILSFSIMGMCVCEYVCAHEKRFLWRPEEHIVSSGAEVSRGSEMP